MSEEFGNDLLTISDEDGNDYTLEHIDTLELDGKTFLACLPADIEEDDEDYGLVILEVTGDDELASIEDDDQLEELYDRFIERLYDDEYTGDEDDGMEGTDDGFDEASD